MHFTSKQRQQSTRPMGPIPGDQSLSNSIPRHVGDIMSSPMRQVEPETTLSQLERMFVDHGLSAVPVVEKNGELLGIVTKSDLNRAEAFGRRLPDALIRPELDAILWSKEDEAAPAGSWLVAMDLMSSRVETIDSSADPLEAARRMTSLEIHHLLVTKGDDVVGMISSLDLVAMLAGLRHPLPLESEPPPGRRRRGARR